MNKAITSVSVGAAGANRVSGVPRPLWPIYVVNAAQALGGRVAVLVPDDNCLQETVGLLRDRTTLQVVDVPAWDVPLLDHTDPDPRIIARRMVSARRIAADDWDVIVVEATSQLIPLCLPTLDPVFDIAVDSELEPVDLQQRGYRRVSEVSAPGEYCVRGDIIDVWSPLEVVPVRVERFDTVIDALRLFDVASQLSTRTAVTYQIGYAGYFVDEAANQQIVEQVSRRARRLHSGPTGEARLRDAIVGGRSYPGQDLWRAGQLAVAELPAQWQIVVDPDGCQRNLSALVESTESERRSLDEEGVPYPYVDYQHSVDATHVYVGSQGENPEHVVSLPQLSRLDARKWFQQTATQQPLPQRIWLTGHANDRDVLAKYSAEYEGTAELTLVSQSIKGSWDIPALGLRIIDGSRMLRRHRVGRMLAPRRDADLGDMVAGSLVVHEEYGIGRYVGFERTTIDDVSVDMVRLEFRDGDTVLVPAPRINVLSPFHGDDPDGVELDKLGGDAWVKRKARVREELVKFAGELIRIYARREQATRAPLPPAGELSAAIEASFPWEETPDQLRALEEIAGDLATERPMDRLLAGDVGYGKTEIALRTAIRFVEAGQQAAILVPTTVLTSQHGRTFRERLDELPVRVGVLSRFSGATETRDLIDGLRNGRVDIVVGTHRLLQPDVSFARLGLLVIDEEHRFGVKHKEALKNLRSNVDSLAMSATPIPRTLQMHMGGLRPMSIIATPPPSRLAVETRVMAYDEDILREAIVRERNRSGQVFVLQNRIEALDELSELLRSLVPDLRISIVHGKMAASDIENVFSDFLEYRTDVLIATTIIESGLDFPRANTLIVMDAQNHGLADLYQLRGRVGRSDRRAFAYLFHPGEATLSDKASKRLDVLHSFSNLGGGFHVAMRDLEIRGAGEILGKKQAGNLRSVGISTMIRLLQEAVAEVHGEHVPDQLEPDIRSDRTMVLPEDWIDGEQRQLRAYQRLAMARSSDEVDGVLADLQDRFGPIPDGVNDNEFLASARLRPLLIALHVRSLSLNGNRASVYIEPTTPLQPQDVIAFAQAHDHVELKPDRLVIDLGTADGNRFERVGLVLSELAGHGLADRAG